MFVLAPGGLVNKTGAKFAPESQGSSNKPVGYFWRGADGKVYVQGENGIHSAGVWDANTANYYGSRGFVQTPASPTNAPSNIPNGNGVGISAGGGAVKSLDTAGLQSLDSLIANLDNDKSNAIRQATLRRDAAKKQKEEEKKLEEGKYQGKKLSTLQDFAGAKTDTDLNTRNTLENLVSSLSTLGLGGSRALTRQILDAANMSNRKANATQAKDNQGLDSAFNEYSAGNDNDQLKIADQYGYEAGKAEQDYLKAKQTALYKKADIYNAADDTGNRSNLMNEANGLNGMISGAAFLNPQYTGETKTMATPELGDYTQNIAKYDTTGIGASPGVAPAGNLAVRAIAVNDKDLGIKKKTESELGYGV